MGKTQLPVLFKCIKDLKIMNLYSSFYNLISLAIYNRINFSGLSDDGYI